MDMIPASDARTHFGALLDKALDEPVIISRNGRAIAVVVAAAEFDLYLNTKLETREGCVADVNGDKES